MRRKNQIVLTFKAGDCAFYKSKHPKTGASLEEQGVLKYARAPSDFEPDLHKLASNTRSIAVLAQAIESYDDSQLRVLMYALHTSHQLTKHGLKFGQTVFKNLSTDHDYLDCWFRCYVIGLGPLIEGTQFVRLTGSLDDIHGSMITVPMDSFMERSEFGVHRRSLIAEGKLRAPRSVRDQILTHKNPQADSADTFPSLEEVADKLVTVSDKQTRPKSNRRMPKTYQVIG